MRSQYNKKEIQIIEKELSKSNLEELSKSKKIIMIMLRFLQVIYLKNFLQNTQKSFGV